jgi:DedD protein
MDRGLKERLIGAAVLVALGVWLIPLILDGPRIDPNSESAGLELPGAGEPAPLRTQTIRLDEPAEAPGERIAAEPVRPAETGALPAVGEAPPVASAPEPARATVTPPASAPGADRVTEERSTASTAAPAPQTATAIASAPRPAPAAGDWMVQLGSFGEEENARRLAERVSGYGYSAEISPHRAGGRTMHRVRIGPYETRPRAEAVVSSLSAHGFVAQVVVADGAAQ